MEQPCYKCGQLVEQGRPFCPHCAAPQIRVVVAQTVPAVKSFATSDAAQEGEAELPASETVPVLAVPVRWSQAFKPCVLAALVGSLLMLLRLYPVVSLLGVGFFAVVFYRGSRPGVVVKGGTGARLGSLGGLLCSAIIAFVIALGAMVPDIRSKMQQQFIEVFQKAAAASPDDPRVRALLEQLKTPEGFITVLIVMGVGFLILAVLLGSLSGAATAALLGRRDRREN